MVKIQVKPSQETVEKIKKAVAKKVQEAKKTVVSKAKDSANDTGKKGVSKVKVKVAETGKKEGDKLHAHAIKHLNSWHKKAGENAPEFAKTIAKHARTLLAFK